MCVCASTRPGSTYSFDRSMTSAPGGIGTFPTALIRSPSTTITWLGVTVPLSGFTRNPALIATTLGEAEGNGVWATAGMPHTTIATTGRSSRLNIGSSRGHNGGRASTNDRIVHLDRAARRPVACSTVSQGGSVLARRVRPWLLHVLT